MRTFIAVVLTLSMQIACATTYQASGTVLKVVNLDRATYGTNPDSALIYGFTTAGTCATNDGLVAVILKDDEGGKRQLASLLAAKVSGTGVTVRVDDTKKNAAGFCYLQVLELT